MTAGILVFVAVTRPGGGDGDGIARDRPAPAVTGTTLDGQPLDLADYRGRPVVLNFWASWCVPCRNEFPLLEERLAELGGDDGLAIVGVLYKDGPDAARAFVAEYGAPWPSIEDPGGALATEYRVVAPPQTYFIDRYGIVRSIQIGEVLPADFDRQYALIAGSATASAGPDR